VVASPYLDGSAVPTALAGWLRGRVLRLRQGSTRRNFASCLELVRLEPGALDESPLVFRADTARADDHALRVELLTRMLVDCEPWPAEGRAEIGGDRHALVHVRPGPPQLADSDIAWAAAARCQAGMTTLHLERVLVVTRWGWVDVASGEHRTWVRLRA
jgi:hypothetical protein